MIQERFNDFNLIQAKSQKRCGTLSPSTNSIDTLSNYCGKFVKSINLTGLGNDFKSKNTPLKNVKSLNLKEIANDFKIPLLYR